MISQPSPPLIGADMQTGEQLCLFDVSGFGSHADLSSGVTPGITETIAAEQKTRFKQLRLKIAET